MSELAAVVDETQRVRIADFQRGVVGTGKAGQPGLFGVSSEGAWPAPWPLGSIGIGPGPERRSASGSLNASTPKLTANDGQYLFVASGADLYRWSGSGSVAHRLNLAASAVDMVRRGDDLFVAFNGSADVMRWNDGTSTVTGSVLGSGYEAHRLGASGELLVSANAANPKDIDIWNKSVSTSTTISLAGEVRRMVNFDDALIIATNRDLYALHGIRYTDFSIESRGSAAASLQAEDDYAWMKVYQGRLVSWVGGSVVGYDQTRGTWLGLGLEGESSTGAAVVGGWLFVAAKAFGAVSEQLWGYDGAGWWLLHSPDSYPAAAGDGKLAAFQSGSSALFYYEPGDLNTASNLASPFEVTTDLLYGAVPEADKHWTEIAIELARTDDESVGSWSYELEYSINSGTTWTTAATQTVTNELATISAPIDATATALRIRITATQVSGLPPFIRAIRAGYETTSASPTATTLQRTWSFNVAAHDNGIDRDGAADNRAGQTIRSALWNVYANANPVAFHDVDYSADPNERSVRLIEISEVWTNPADQPALGAQTTLTLILEEVS